MYFLITIYISICIKRIKKNMWGQHRICLYVRKFESSLGISLVWHFDRLLLLDIMYRVSYTVIITYILLCFHVFLLIAMHCYQLLTYKDQFQRDGQRDDSLGEDDESERGPTLLKKGCKWAMTVSPRKSVRNGLTWTSC